MKKAGIIYCQQTDGFCHNKTDYKGTKEGKMVFEETGPVEVVGFVSCGECTGEQAIEGTKVMVDRGAEVIIFRQCFSKVRAIGYTCSAFSSYSRLGREYQQSPDGYPCPHYANMRDSILRLVGKEIPLIECTF